jgi:hypothetical protein
MILLVVGLVAVLVVVFIAVILSIRLGHGDEHDEPDLPSRGRGRQSADEDEHWQERDTRRVPAAAARGMDTRGRRGDNPGYDDHGVTRDRDRAARGRDYDAPPRRPARAGAVGYREPAAARSPVPASAQARGRYDTGPQRRPADSDFPSADYPSMDFGPVGARPLGDHPSVEFPAADYGVVDHPEDRPGPRRKAGSANGKSRSRQRGKRNNNEDDWPSTEWDKLSDEQYWAELSADKPLAAMATAKPSRPATPPAGKFGAPAPVNGGAKRKAEPPAARKPRRARTPAPTPPAQELPGRGELTEPREAVTERLPVRTRQQPPGSRRDAGPPSAGSPAPGPRSVRDTGPQPRRDPLRDTGPWTQHDTGPHPIRDTGPHPSRDARPRPEQPRRDTARDRDLATLAGLASTPPPVPGALDDDPLTSPSFSVTADTAADSRSYGGSRKHAKPSGRGAASGNGTAHANGHDNGNGSYPTADYAGAGHAYRAAPPAAPVEQWHSAPPAPARGRHTAGYGNPYQQAGPSASNGGYGTDPLGGYSPGYEAPRYAEPAGPAHQALPDSRIPAPPGPVPHANGRSRHAYPGQGAYPDGHSAGGYTNGYDAGYGGDPYDGRGYGPYAPRG